MSPTLKVGQLIHVVPFDDTAAVVRDVRRGDLVAYKWPIDTSRRYVKRIAGLPSDTLSMTGGTLTVNGMALSEPYAGRADSVPLEPSPEIEDVAGKLPSGKTPDRANWGPLVVPRGFFFVLGDNRDWSLDSRYWGFVPASHIIGRANAEPQLPRPR